MRSKIFSLMFITIFMITLTSCGSSSVNGDESASNRKGTNENASNETEEIFASDTANGVTATWGFSPLTYDIFLDFRNGSLEFTQFTLDYRKYMNRDSNERPREYEFFGIIAGHYFKRTDMNSITEFGSGLVKIDNINMTRENPRRYFSKEEVDEIFNYLDANNGYFFNGEEFEELDDPYITNTITMDWTDHTFTLIIPNTEVLDPSFQESYVPAWAINKCIDEVDLYPDHTLSGLFDLLEDNFISQFE